MITAAIVAGTASPCFAQEAKQPEGEQQTGQEPRKTALYQGVVQDVDLKKKIVTVGKPKSELGTAFHSSKAKLVGYKKLKDIKPGATR